MNITLKIYDCIYVIAQNKIELNKRFSDEIKNRKH